MKMILEWSLGANVEDPDNVRVAFDHLKGALKEKDYRKQLADLKRNGGGLELAYKLMSSMVYQYSVILFCVQHSCWNWYTYQVENIKTPQDHLHYLHEMAFGRWGAWSHLREMIHDTFYSIENLNWIGIANGDTSDLAKKVSSCLVNLAMHLLSQRGWSLSRHACPPEAYVDVLSDNVHYQKEACAKMKKDVSNVHLLENKRFKLPIAMQLWTDIIPCKQSPIRVIWALFERDHFRADCLPGRKILLGMLSLIPSNKPVEDLNKTVREDQNENPNRKMKIAHMQDLIMQSGVIEGLGISHSARLGEQKFVRGLRSANARCKRRSYISGKLKMKLKWSRMCLKKKEALLGTRFQSLHADNLRQLGSG